MGNCHNTVKRVTIRWWTRTSTKGGSLPRNGPERRALSDRLWLFSWRKAQAQSRQTEHLASQIGSDSPNPGNGDSTSIFLKEMLVKRLDAERTGHEVTPQDLPGAQKTEVSSSALQAAAPDSPEPATQLEMRIPGWKRALDLTLVVLTYPIWLPLMLVVMAAIKISSPGPIFYRQERVGFRGRIFMIFKFRSMKVHAQTSWHERYFQRLMRDGAPMTKLDVGDDQIIPWGRFLRATGLDELPQLFNVLRGEMSLVGPRPCTPLEFEKYEEWERERVKAPPGLTGYWQVNGKNRTTFQEMIEMDLYYTKNASVRLDLWIMAKTPAALFEQTVDLVHQRTVALATKLGSEPQTAAAHLPDEGAGSVLIDMS